jgi:hypothetical protein
MSEKVLKCFEQSSFAGSRANDSKLVATGSEPISIDASGLLKEMW